MPGRNDLLVETFPRGDRWYLVAYCFEGRNAHQTLGMLLTRRMERAGYAPLGFVATDYVLGVWSAEQPRDVAKLFDQDMLGDDLEAWLAESSMLRRTFRNVAVIAGLIERHHPGAEKTRKQVTVNSDLIYDVLRRHQPDHILLRATRADAAGGLTDLSRIAGMLTRVKGRVVHMVLSRVSPLAVPVLLEIGRESVRSRRGRGEAAGGGRGDHRGGNRRAEPPPWHPAPPDAGIAVQFMTVSPAPSPRPPPARGGGEEPTSPPPLAGGGWGEGVVVPMTAAPIHLAGERLMLDPAGALHWPATSLLAVSDLHLEKGSSYARRGQLLPPWDTHATLDRLDLAAPPLPAPPRDGPRRQLPRRRRLQPPPRRRALPPSCHDRGAPFHLGAGQPRPHRRQRGVGGEWVEDIHHHHA